MQGSQSLTGVIERITFVNNENGYTVARIRSKGCKILLPLWGICRL